LHRSAKFGLYGLVLAGLLGGTAAWATGGKSVDLRVDGQERQVHTRAHDVRGVLAAAHVAVGEHDLVAPDLASSIKDGSQIVLNRGHLLNLTVDGHARNLWVNAGSVDEALKQLGFGTENLVSVSRSKRLDTGATKLSITSPKPVTFKVDGKSVKVSSLGPTVRQALVEAHVSLSPTDRMSVASTSVLRANEVITIKRVKYAQQLEQVSLPFNSVRQQDPNTLKGTSSVLSQGSTGVERVTYQLLYIDGKLAGKVVKGRTVLRAPVDQVTMFGTEELPAPAPAPAPVPVPAPAPAPAPAPSGDPQQIAAGMVSARGWGGDQFSCLVSLWTKESGWRTDAANPSGAYGIPQALPGSKMSSAGADWQTSATTQISWGLDYIAGVYGTPCAAWGHSQATDWY